MQRNGDEKIWEKDQVIIQGFIQTFFPYLLFFLMVYF